MRQVIAGIGAFCLALGMVACGGDDGAPADSDLEAADELVIDGEMIADTETWQAAQEEGRLTLYMANAEDAWRPVIEQFTEDTGIDVEIVRLVSAQLYERVLSEHAAGSLAADVIDIGEDTLVDDLREQGVFQPHEVPNVSDLPEEFTDPEGMTTVGSLNSMVPAYNTAIVDEADAPRSWEDLLDPYWKDKLGITYIGIGGSAFAVAMLQQDVYGPEYWQKLADQNPSILESVVPLAEEIVRGELAGGVPSTAVVLDHMEQGAPVNVVFPEEGIPAFPTFLGIPESAENVNAAKVFINWRASAHGSQVAFEITGTFPVNPAATSVEIAGVEIPSTSDANVFIANDEMWDRRDEYVSEWNELFNYNN